MNKRYLKNFKRTVKEVILIIVAVLCFTGFVYGFYNELVTNNHNVELTQEDAEDIIMSQQIIDMYY